MKYVWKIGGEAGFGIMTVGLSFSKIATRSGYHIFDYTEYPSLIRGGHNTYEVVISDEEVRSLVQSVDLLICLNKETYLLHKSRLTPESVVVYDKEEFDFEEPYHKIQVPFRSLKKEYKAPQVMVNTIALGASLALLGGDIDIFHNLIDEQFSRKGKEIVEYNTTFAKLGFDHIINNYHTSLKQILKKQIPQEKIVMTGNDAFSFASVVSDCRLYSAYPMTPSSTVLGTVAGWQAKTGMVVRHAEDEIAVVNTALGASFAGVRSAVGTSGGGFALMVESLSFAGVAEIPLVVFLSQRPGPATGIPTWTEQGDLLFACFSGHGEFPKIVLAPGDITEMMELTARAFDLADIYQTPVIVLSDKMLSESHKSELQDTVMSFISSYTPNRGKTVSSISEGTYLRYKLSEDGISERLIPGFPGHFYQANSYEHVEDGHTTEDAKPRREQADKREKKWATYLTNHFKPPVVYGDATAETVFVSWGSNKGTILEAQKQLQAKGISSSYIHFTHMYPLKQEAITPLFQEKKRYILVENNSWGQLGQLLRMQTGIDIKEKILKYDGRPFWPEEIVKETLTIKY